jgi:selenide,water dikinase
MGPEALAQVLRPLQDRFHARDFPDLLVGLEISDDAAVWKVSDDVAVIQTVDFFTPVVDDPYDYGAVAAANAMSDVYAMGGEVVLALNICAFPSSLPLEVTQAILRGGADKVAEAGAVLAGGHTIEGPEPVYGLAVMGLVHPQKVLTKAGARPGDALVLTKPLGVGLVTTALKGQAADPAHVATAVQSMARLNRGAARIAQDIGVNACTDITGFSLLGHGYEMAEKSGVRLRLHLDSLPFLPGARRYAAESLFPGGSCRNRDAYAPRVTFARTIEDETRMLLFTPETSGGLLLSVPADRLADLLARFAAANEPAWPIGEVGEGQGIEVVGAET